MKQIQHKSSSVIPLNGPLASKMRSRVHHSIHRYTLFVIFSLIFSCDWFDEDTVRPALAQAEYYTLPGSSVVVDLTSLAKQSFANSSLSISKSPARGILSTLDTLLLKYKPGLDFTDGEDQFILSISSDGKLISQTVTIHMNQRNEDLPCAMIPIEDQSTAKSGSSVTIRILENDWICNVDKSIVSVSIHSNPLFGTVSVTGDSIVYTPGPAFESNDEFVYKLTASTGRSTAYGIISISEWAVKILDAPIRASAMFFVDQNIGFLGGSGLYKTIDGGEHWKQIFGSSDVTFRLFTSIHFLDASVGFAVYDCIESDMPCMSGLMRTTDGGSSWSEFHILASRHLYGVEPLSIFFTSPMTGYLAAVLNDGWEGPMLSVNKSNDGGEFWGEVAAFYPGPFRASMGFTNSNNGFLHLTNDIWVTNDSGDSWTKSFSRENTYSVDIAAENIICAIVSNASAGTPSSSIIRSTDGSTWQDVANFTHEIDEIQFSPTGNLGITIGVNKTDTETKILFINKSLDKGLTWTQEDANDHINASFKGSPVAIAVPSDNVFYLLWYGKIIKYSNH